MKLTLLVNVVLISLIGLAGCGGGGGSSSGSSSQATVTFSVSSTSPQNGAIQKSDFPVVAIFSKAVDEALIDSINFSVMTGGTPVSGVFTFSQDRKVVIFTPDADLTDGSIYTMTVNTNVKSVSNESLAANKTWSFTAKDKATYSCIIGTPPASLGLDPYYTKYCDANGMPVIGGNLVPEAALQKAWLQTMNMMKMRQDLLAEMVRQGTKVAIVAEGEGITQIPEYSDIDTVFPLYDKDGNQVFWDSRARGLGATPTRPISSGAEENLLCLGTDPYLGENIFIHEFAHSVEGMGIFFAEPETSAKIQAAYDSALANGLYTNTYADDTVYEYWAEGVQNWFNVNLEAIPSDSIHNEINTRAELKTYDPALYSLISNIFPADWQPVCP